MLSLDAAMISTLRTVSQYQQMRFYQYLLVGSVSRSTLAAWQDTNLQLLENLQAVCYTGTLIEVNTAFSAYVADCASW